VSTDQHQAFAEAQHSLSALLRAAAAEPASGAVRRFETPAPVCDGIGWLAAQEDEVKGYWSDRDSLFEVAAVGEADVVKNAGAVDYDRTLAGMRTKLAAAAGNVRYYGGFRFGPPHPKDESWKLFGSARFILPAIEYVRRGAGAALACNVPPGPDGRRVLLDAAARVERLVAPGSDGHRKPGRPVGRMDSPEREGWAESVRHVLDLIGQGRLSKLVLARRSVFGFREPVDTVALLRALQARTEGAFRFCGSHARHVGFVGASPERLYRRDGRSLSAEAVAGTRPRGATPAEDDALGAGLLSSAKEQAEHAFVVDSIRDALAPLCDKMETSGRRELLKLGAVQHLRTRIDAVLKPGVGDALILARLHPTPAVGGHPREAALAEIAALEGFDRGWYAAPVGWVGRETAEFIVALRCGAVWDNRLCLYAGAGIVAGSDPQSEWEEIESKISHFVSVFDEP
jgi:menaquinone-specific isochorismate synthase